MTPLERMAEAYEQERKLWGVRDNQPPKRHEVVRVDPEEDFIFISDRFDNIRDARSHYERTRALCAMAEALRTLAEMELDEETLEAGVRAAFAADLSEFNKSEAAFRAILRSLIEEAGTADTDPSTPTEACLTPK